MKISTILLAGLLALPAPLLAADDGGGGLFSVDPGLSVWTIIVFVGLLVFLAKFAWGPILGALDAREEGIRTSIDEAARLQAEAERLLEAHRKQLADARRQAQEIVAEGREAGERVRKEIEGKARAEADRMLKRARTEITRERDLAVQALRSEAVDLSLALAAKLLDERLNEEADRELVKGYLAKLDQPAAEA